MAIRLRGSKYEYMFTRFHGNGVVDAINLTTGSEMEDVPITRFYATGGTNEIIREVRNISQATDLRLKREER